ncbi:TPA: YqaE/Pmp3 family membrane protein [Citrobacter braakii]
MLTHQCIIGVWFVKSVSSDSFISFLLFLIFWVPGSSHASPWKLT